MAHDAPPPKIVIYHPSSNGVVGLHFIAQGTYSGTETLTATVQKRGGAAIPPEALLVRDLGPEIRWDARFKVQSPGRYKLHVKDSLDQHVCVPIRVTKRRRGGLRPVTDPEIFFPRDDEATPPHPTAYGSVTGDKVWVRFSGSENYPNGDPAEASVDSGFWSANIEIERNTNGDGNPLYTCYAALNKELTGATTTTGIWVGGMMG